MAWFKPSDLSAAVYPSGGGSLHFFRIDSTSAVSFRLEGTDNAFTGLDTINANAWTHIAITRNSADLITVYINGSAQTDTETCADKFLAMRWIGTHTGSSNFYKGWIDEFMVYNKGLTAAQVLKNYNHAKSKHSN